MGGRGKSFERANREGDFETTTEVAMLRRKVISRLSEARFEASRRLFEG